MIEELRLVTQSASMSVDSLKRIRNENRIRSNNNLGVINLHSFIEA